MKKLLSIALAICMLVAFTATLTSCDESGQQTEQTTPASSESTTESATESDTESETKTETETETETEGPSDITKEEWQAAIADQKFDNVTIHYTLTMDGESQAHIVKIADDMVYRKVTMTMFGEEFSQAICFTDEEGAEQREMFLIVFLSLLAEKDNFVFDPEEGVFKAPNEVTATVEGSEEGWSAHESMNDGKVKFSIEGNLEYFACTLTETTYIGEEELNSYTCDAMWTFSDYGKTVITEEEQAATDFGGSSDGGDEEVSLGVSLNPEQWNAAIQISNFNNVTMTSSALFLSGNDSNTDINLTTFWLDGNTVKIQEGEDYSEVSTDAEMVSSVRTWYIDTTLAIVENFDDFTYDEELGCYAAGEPIVYNVTIEDYNATITARDALVAFDEDMHIAYIMCEMTQEFEEDGEQKTFVIEVAFTFYDYGTTVIEAE
ncbi:MAG: hypothetical protein E7589_05185 [Ruminococcaceae bacterium]|nr:hypothetical protein [Oscillospiraceae bacterium]